MKKNNMFLKIDIKKPYRRVELKKTRIQDKSKYTPLKNWRMKASQLKNKFLILYDIYYITGSV